MYPISASQIKAARALLDWSQDDLAEAANVSRTTIRSVEMGYAVRANNIAEIYKALEKNGVEFLDDEGVKRQSEEMKTYRGSNGCDKFFDEILKVAHANDSDIICYIQSQDMLTRPSGATHRTNLERLEEIQKVTDVKCLVSDNVRLPLTPPSFQIRIMPERSVFLPSSCFVYGDQWVFAYQDRRMQSAFAVFQKAALAHSCQNHFLQYWNAAKPYIAETAPQKIHA
jgi:DNA-binding XRE family transcriptional regulator